MKTRDTFYAYLGGYNFDRNTYANGGWSETGYVRTKHGVVGINAYWSIDRHEKATYYLLLNFGAHRRRMERKRPVSERYIITLARRFADEKVSA